MEEHRHVVVGVDPGGHDDLQLGLRGHPLDAGNVAAQADHGRVDDGVHPDGFECVELVDGVGLPGSLVTPTLRVVRDDFRRQHEDVLVHQHDTQVPGCDRAPHGLDL